MDWELICKLLDVIDGTRGLPKLKPIHDEAELTLIDMVEDAQKLLDVRKQDAKKAEADTQAKAQLEKEKEKEANDEEEATHARRA